MRKFALGRSEPVAKPDFVLRELRIENLLLIERAELRLGEGLNAGDWVTVDGDSGEVFAGNVGVMMSRLDAFEAELRDWAASAPARRQA